MKCPCSNFPALIVNVQAPSAEAWRQRQERRREDWSGFRVLGFHCGQDSSYPHSLGSEKRFYAFKVSCVSVLFGPYMEYGL